MEAYIAIVLTPFAASSSKAVCASGTRMDRSSPWSETLRIESSAEEVGRHRAKSPSSVAQTRVAPVQKRYTRNIASQNPAELMQIVSESHPR
jgi:hypothetical protein